jgi:hypothetical protein
MRKNEKLTLYDMVNVLLTEEGSHKGFAKQRVLLHHGPVMPTIHHPDCPVAAPSKATGAPRMIYYTEVELGELMSPLACRLIPNFHICRMCGY